MRFWISVCSHGRRLQAPLHVLLIASLLLTASGNVYPAVAAPWEWSPLVSFGTGHESDRVLDRDLDRTIVPGGTFLDLAPEVSVTDQLGPRSHVRINGELHMERFLNGADRSVLSGALTGDLVAPGGRQGQWRVTLGGTYLGDSERETVNRYTLGLETAYSRLFSKLRLELQGGLQSRTYPNLESLDQDGAFGTYGEGSLDLRGSGTLRASERLLLEGWISWRGTQSRDPLFDATSLTAQGAGTLRLAERTRLTAQGLLQERQFGSRVAGEDRDSYWQLGTGVQQGLSGNLGVSVRYAFARYQLTTGVYEDIQRLTVTATWRLGSGSRDMARPSRPVTIAQANQDYGFRLYAPGARRVTVVGDFNGWKPGVHPLKPEGNGWWRLDVRLPAGSYQYVYQVDGETIVPPEAEVVVEDGFGGRNGLLRVVSAGA